MPTGSLNLTPLFTCGLHRPNLRSLPPTLDNALSSLRGVRPPIDVVAFHNADHLISFAHHVQQILNRPVEVKELDGHRLVHILGQAVLARTPDGTLDLYLWCQSFGDASYMLKKVPPINTPFLDFPRTTLWTENLQGALQREARARVGFSEWADPWAKWAWSWIAFKVISRRDVHRLRAQIRGALDLDPVVFNLLRRRRQFAVDATWFVPDYNVERIHRDATLLLEREAPALLPLYWALREHPDFDRSLEPKKAIRKFVRLMGITPQQWKLIAESGHRGQRVYRALCREFFVGSEFDMALSYLRMIRLLRPKRLPTIEFWRQVLSIYGTRRSPPDKDYADALASYQETLRHIVRLADARAEARQNPFPEEELHAVLAWIADRGIKQLTRTQRSAGWGFLVRRAEKYRQTLRQPVTAPLAWEPVLPAFEVGQFRAIPLESAASVWEEAVEMRHCADRYIAQCVSRDVALFSLRRRTGKRVATVAFANNGIEWTLLELAGKANTEASAEVRHVAGRVFARMRGVPVDRLKASNSLPEVPEESSFAEGTCFYDVEGVPVTLEPSDDTALAWEPHINGPRARSFGVLRATQQGEKISREQFFQRFSAKSRAAKHSR